LQPLDADAFDDLAGEWAQQATMPGPGARRVIAVDGKTLRGSGAGGEAAVTCSGLSTVPRAWSWAMPTLGAW
jgi:hypothetical protein